MDIYKSNKKRKELLIVMLLIPIVGVFIAMMFGNIQIWKSEVLFYVLHSIFSTAVIWLGCFAIVTYLWRKYPWERHPVKHLIIEIVAILLYVNIFGFIIHKVNLACNLYPDPELVTLTLNVDYFMTILITFLITSIHEAAFFYKQWKINFSKSARLEKDNIEAKYETLKSQINPHFLFNSLNSLSNIVDENKEATHYIQNLSEFLRYVLKSRDRELVLVRDEIQILEKYFNLQKTRFRENLLIDLNVDERFYHFSLPPLVLQMLVENCIKHNVISKEKPLTIKVYAEKEILIIENNLQKKKSELSTQQGLRNITERFAFFTNREVNIVETSTKFKVEIPLLTVEI
jgi:LytS/YehU family sensor histidine kinase